jgi:hypothetical protein
MFFRHRTVVVVAGLAGSVLGVACSSSTGAPIVTPDKPALSGQYTASGAGSITEVSFYDSSYSLWRSPCADGSGATCLEEGTFTVNDDLSVLTLTNGATGQSSTLPMQVLQAASVRDLVPESVTFDDPSDDGLAPAAGGGGSLVGDGGALVNGDGGPLLAASSAPPALTVKTGSQTLTRSGPPPVCTFDKTFTGSASDLFTKLQAAAKGNSKDTLTGDDTGGHVELYQKVNFLITVSIGADYKVNGQSVHIEITHKPGAASCQQIDGALNSALGTTG